MANHEFLKLEKVLDNTVVDVFSFLQYTTDRNKAELAQHRFQMEINNKKKK